jgi:hypothetical protein
MMDIRVNNKIVSELERMLLLARAGGYLAVAIVAITKDHMGDMCVEMQPEQLLVPALGGMLSQVKTELEIAQIRDRERQMMKTRGAA